MYAVRYKQYKAHFYTQGAYNSGPNNHDPDCRPTANLTRHDPPLLYDLHVDPSEQFALNTTIYKDIVQKTTDLYHKVNAEMEWGPSQINSRDKAAEPCCNKGCTPLPSCCHCGKGGKSINNKYSQKLNSVRLNYSVT